MIAKSSLAKVLICSIGLAPLVMASPALAQYGQEGYAGPVGTPGAAPQSAPAYPEQQFTPVEQPETAPLPPEGAPGYAPPDYTAPGYAPPGYAPGGYGGEAEAPAPYSQGSWPQFAPYGDNAYRSGLLYHSYGVPSYNSAPQYSQAPAYQMPQTASAPAGLVIQATLSSSISTQVASRGDYVQASVSQNVPLGSGLSYIPAGSVISGQITSAEPGRFFERSGSLEISFNQLRLPNGTSVPIQAHLVGKLGKYQQTGQGNYRGEGWGTKLGNLALRSALGVGAGMALGTAVGAIASHGSGWGSGMWSGAAIGGGLGLADDLILRKGRNVLIHSGTPLQIQLDQPLQIPVQSQFGAS